MAAKPSAALVRQLASQVRQQLSSGADTQKAISVVLSSKDEVLESAHVDAANYLSYLESGQEYERLFTEYHQGEVTPAVAANKVGLEIPENPFKKGESF